MERKTGGGGDSPSYSLELPRTVQSPEYTAPQPGLLPSIFRRPLATTSDLTNHPQCPATCLYILILVLISSTVKSIHTELHYYLLTSSQPNLSGFQSLWKEVRLKEIVTLIVPQSSCSMTGRGALKQVLQRCQFKTILRAQGSKHIEQGAAKQVK